MYGIVDESCVSCHWCGICGSNCDGTEKLGCRCTTTECDMAHVFMCGGLKEVKKVEFK